MIKQTVINNIKLIFGTLATFIVAGILHINLAIPACLFCLYIYSRFKNIKGPRFLYLIFLFVINIAISYFIVDHKLSVFILPFSLLPMLTAVLFNSLEISMILTVASAVSIPAIAGNRFNLGLLFLVSGIISSILSLSARRRIVVIRTGFIVGAIQILVLIFIDRFWVGSPARYMLLMLNSVISSIIVLGTLPVFEYLFGTVTNISLLELADFNHPILQRMIMEAPGTYHHSLIVGNLSDAASRAVGANPLLARVGAYYHDIGKIEKADYFSENQVMQVSKHDELSPTMSKIVIMNHVKEGVEIAKRYKLSPRLIDFIQQHHGDSLVYYFYRRALENLEEDNNVKEEGFRYPGPKPNSKETAIVLLADSVEAATRALKEPSGAKAEEVVHKIINNKFIDGQLDECDLTLKDVEKISEVFVRILGGIYHSRIDYPETKKSENNHKKSAKDNSYQPEKDKKDGS